MNCKQLILLLFILKNTICNAQIFDSISVGVDSLLDFKIELNKIKDTLSENQKIPSIFKNYSLLDDEIIIKNRNNLITLNKLSESNREIKLIDNSASVLVLEKETGISPGQACVFYSKDDHGDKVLGGGWIDRTFNRNLST